MELAKVITHFPVLRIEPWMHVIMFSAGAYGGAKLPQLERKLVEDINERRAERGFGPLIGTVGWIRYKEPEA